MFSIDVDSLTRDSNLSKKLLTVTKDGQITANENFVVLVPGRYLDRGLMFIDQNIDVLGVYALVYKNKYTISNIPAFVSLSPFSLEDTEIKDIPYKVLSFKKGDVFITTTSVIKNESVIKDAFNEFILKGNLPWFFNYDDPSKLFSLSNEYAGSKAGNDIAVFELLNSIIARDPVDKLNYYRKYINKTKTPKDPSYIPMLSVYYSFTNTTNKLVGSYMRKGIVSSLVNKSTETETIEKMLRA